LNSIQDKRLIRLSNKAQTLAEAYKQSSLLVPIAIPQRRLPPNISLDYSSPWHTSALLATALETATLPSRLRNRATGDSLDTITGLLNVMGKQSIAGLQLSIHKPEGPGTAAGGRDRDDIHEDDSTERVQLDVDFNPPDEVAPGRSHRNGFKQPRLFGQAVTDRGRGSDAEPSGSADMGALIGRRHAQQPVSRR